MNSRLTKTKTYSMTAFPYNFCLIYDLSFTDFKSADYVVKGAIDGGVNLILFRDYTSEKDKIRDIALFLRRITGDRNAGFFVSKHIDIALETGADGVHVGRDYFMIEAVKGKLGDRFVSASCHNAYEVLSASMLRADMLLVSPLFVPGSKSIYTPPLGIDRFLNLAKLTSVPVFALGGINAENVHIVFPKKGVHGIACITALLQSQHVMKTAKKIMDKMVRISK